MTEMIHIIIESLKYDFIRNAILVGSLVAVSCSFLGIFLVLKKFSMIGDGLAHVGFASVAFALLLSASPLLVSIPVVITASFLILRLNEKAEIYGDTAIALVSSSAVAIGVLIASLADGFNVDLFSYLFGSLLIIGKYEIIVSSVISIIVISTVIILYRGIFAVSYDEEFANVIGVKSSVINHIMAVLTAVTITVGIRVVGTMLISSMIIFPTVSALQTSKSFFSTIITASVISIFCVISGILISIGLNLPTGASIVILQGIVLLASMLAKKLH